MKTNVSAVQMPVWLKSMEIVSIALVIIGLALYVLQAFSPTPLPMPSLVPVMLPVASAFFIAAILIQNRWYARKVNAVTFLLVCLLLYLIFFG